MGLVGDLAKTVLLLTVAYWIYLIFQFAVMGQTVWALVLFVVFLIPLSMIVYEYRQYKKKD